MEIAKRLALFLAFFALVCATPAKLAAQVSLDLEISSVNFIQYEPVYAKVTMRNFSAHPLAFGENKALQGKMKFDIERADGSFAGLTGKELPPMVGVLIAPGASKTITFILSKYYDLQAKGKYRVKAYVEHPQLTASYESNFASFSVISGGTVIDRKVGVPDYIKTDPTGKIKTRSYRIYDFYDGHNKIYALSVEDENTVYAVHRLGFDMGVTLRPACEIDPLSRIHIMLPVSPKVYCYYLYGIDGKLEKREIYVKSGSTPTLVADKNDGSVMVVGGRIARKDLDYEEYKDLPIMGFQDKPKDIDDEEEE